MITAVSDHDENGQETEIDQECELGKSDVYEVDQVLYGPKFKINWKGYGLTFGNLKKALQEEILKKEVRMEHRHLADVNIYKNTPEVKSNLMKWGLKC